MIVTIADEDQNIVDVSEMFGSAFTLNADAINAKIGSSKPLMADNIWVVSGIVSGQSTIEVSSELFGAHLTELLPSGTPVSIEFLIPNAIHAGEPFPLAIHEVDAGGIPISKKPTQPISSSGFEKIDEGLISIDSVGEQTISVIGRLGGAFQTSVQSFLNELIFDVSADVANARIGNKVLIQIDSPISGVNYNMDSPFPYEQIDETTFSVTPDYEVVDAAIIITGELDGFASSSKQLILNPKNIVEISVNARTSDGKILSPAYDIHLNGEIESAISPQMHMIKPQQVILEFPENYNTAAGGYKLIKLQIDAKTVDGDIIDFYAKSDSTVTATYDKFVQIIVHDGNGGGIYPYGEQIIISAPDKHIVPFLIVEKFDHWLGVQKPQSFAVDGSEDLEITAVYRDDYVGLMLVIFVGVVAGMAVFLKKTSQSDNSDSLMYYVGDYVEKAVSRVKQVIPTKK